MTWKHHLIIWKLWKINFIIEPFSHLCINSYSQKSSSAYDFWKKRQWQHSCNRLFLCKYVNFLRFYNIFCFCCFHWFYFVCLCDSFCKIICKFIFRRQEATQLHVLFVCAQFNNRYSRSSTWPNAKKKYVVAQFWHFLLLHVAVGCRTSGKNLFLYVRTN